MMEQYAFGEAAQLLYRFTWDEYCAWYLELSKRRADDPAAQAVLHRVLDTVLRLLQPLMPFVTQTIWEKLRPDGGMLMEAEWPEAVTSDRDEDLERRMAMVFDAVRLVREVRNRNGISPKVALAAVVSCKDAAVAELFGAGEAIIRAQANLESLEIGEGLSKPSFSGTAAAPDFTVHVPLEGKIDRAAEAERCRREIEKTGKQMTQMERQLGNAEFVKRKPEMAADVRDKLEALRGKLSELEAHLKDLEEAA